MKRKTRHTIKTLIAFLNDNEIREIKEICNDIIATPGRNGQGLPAEILADKVFDKITINWAELSKLKHQTNLIKKGFLN